MAPFNPNVHRRRSIRLEGYDYASKGAYFVTICTHEHACLFGSVEFPKVLLNQAGMMIEKTWDEMAQAYAGVELDLRIVMPNHVHGVIILSSGGSIDVDRPALGDLVSRFKTLTVHRYGIGVKAGNWPAYRGAFWQRNYYERIIRDEPALDEVRAYIEDNPRRWAAKSIGL